MGIFSFENEYDVDGVYENTTNMDLYTVASKINKYRILLEKIQNKIADLEKLEDYLIENGTIDNFSFADID